MLLSISTVAEIIFYAVLTCICAGMVIQGLFKPRYKYVSSDTPTLFLGSVERKPDPLTGFEYFLIILFSFFTYLSLSALIFRYDLEFSNLKDAYNEKTVVHYFNDSVYCTGTYKVTIHVDRAFYAFPRSYIRDTSKIRIGVWNFYYPNGKISSERWYDRKGNETKGKEFRSDGLLKSEYSNIINDDKEENDSGNRTEFENGIISAEQKKEYVVIDGEKKIQETSTDYYPTGMKESTTIILDDNKISSIKWDTTGKIALKLKYRSDNEILIDSM